MAGFVLFGKVQLNDINDYFTGLEQFLYLEGPLSELGGQGPQSVRQK